jgi:hypothetical protein
MQGALANLRSSLNRVREITSDIDANAQAALKDSAIQARHETTLCAATVILSGFLESFLKEIAEEVITDICNRSLPFANLPDKVRITHFWDGAKCVSEMARRERSENPVVLARAADAARRLASVAGSQLPYEILWEAFAETQANPGPGQISDFLRRFDIAKPLPTLAAAMKVSESTLLIGLASFIEVRHECAHTGSATSVPTTTAVRAFCDLIEQVGAGVIAVFEDMLGKPPYVGVAKTLPASPGS